MKLEIKKECVLLVIGRLRFREEGHQNPAAQGCRLSVEIFRPLQRMFCIMITRIMYSYYSQLLW